MDRLIKLWEPDPCSRSKSREVPANGCKMLCMDVMDEKCFVAFVAQKVDPAILVEQVTIGRLC